MNVPVIKDSAGKKVCKSIVKLCDSWLVKYIFTPILFVQPPILLTILATKNELQNDVVSWVGPAIGKFISESALLIIIGSFLYLVVMRAIYAAIRNCAKPERELEVDDLVALVNAINIIVGEKTRRMAIEAKAALGLNNICGRETFLQITRPDQQIPLLIRGLRSVFVYMHTANATFRVGLLRIDNNKAIHWYSFDPESQPPRTHAAVLNAPTSTVSRCIKTKSIIVIDNVQKELKKKSKNIRRFMRGNLQAEDEGSQLCYPIIHSATGNVEYVVTIAGNRSESLKAKYSELYTWIINHFSVRICMEHSLLIMKEKTSDTAEST